MSFCRDQHRHNYGAKKRCPFFHFFAHERKKRPTTRDQTTQKSGLIIHLMISISYTHTHTHPKHKAEEEEDEEEEEEEDEERETTALLFIHISFCLIFLNRSSSSLEVVVFYDSVKARTFFSSVAPKVTYSFGAFFDTKFNDNKNNNHYNNKR